MMADDSVSLDVLRGIAGTKLRALTRVWLPALSEARCTWLLETAFSNWVLGHEGATVDAGFLLGVPEHSLPQNPGERTYHVLDKFHDAENLLAIEVKTCNPRLWAEKHGMWYEYNVRFYKAQRQCGLAIIQNPAAPHLFALMPPSAILPGEEKEREYEMRSKHVWPGSPLHGDKLEPFVIEVSPYVVHRDRLRDAINNYLRVLENPGIGWCNPETGLVIKIDPLPTPQPVNLLKPSDDSHLTDYEIELYLWKAFIKYSAKYRIERMTIRPSTADFYIVSTAPGRQVKLSVELKRGYCAISEDGSITHLARRPGAPENGLGNRFFSAVSSWDYLLSTTSGPGGRNRVLFVSRDDPPRDWFEGTAEKVKWKPDRSFLHRRLMPWYIKSMQSLVLGIEDVFEERMAAGRSLHAEVDYDFVSPSSLEVANALRDRPFGAIRVRPPVVLSDAMDMPNKYRELDWMRERLLKEQCRERKFGWIYRHGLHPTSLHSYAPVGWDREHAPSFYDVHTQTPFVYLNFADVDYVDARAPRICSRRQFHHATHGWGKSIYIIYPFRRELMGTGLNCYVIPSHVLDGDGLLKVANENHIHGKKVTGHHPIRLANCELATAYSCAEDSLIEFVQQICLEWSGQRDSHSRPTEFPSIPASEYLDENVTTRIEVINRIAQMASGNTRYAHFMQNQLGKNYVDD